jgi:hypothetical protein
MKAIQVDFYRSPRAAKNHMRHFPRKWRTPAIRCVWDAIVDFDERFCTSKGSPDFFFCSQAELAEEAGVSERSAWEALGALEGMKMIETKDHFWEDPKTGKKSKRHVTDIRRLM